MARKISQLNAAGALTGAEHVWVEQSGNPVRSTTQDIADLASGGLTAGTVTGSTLRWNGSAWIENTVVKSASAGVNLFYINPDGTNAMQSNIGNGVPTDHTTGLISETGGDQLAWGIYHADGVRGSRSAFFSTDQGQWGLSQSWSSGGAQDFAIWMGNTEYLRLEQSGAKLKLLNNGEMLVPDGTVSAPSFSFVNDENTGIYRAAGDDIRIVAGGVGYLQVRTTDVMVATTLRLEASESLHFEGQNHRITYNDGGGNFNIRHNNYYNSGELYSSTGKACHLEFSDSTDNNLANLEIAAYASGTVDTALTTVSRFYFYNPSNATYGSAFRAASGDIIAGSTLYSGDTGGISISNNNINRESTTDGLNIYGGSGTTGANITLYGGSHASFADWAIYDASDHYFRGQSGSPNYMTLTSSQATINNNLDVLSGIDITNGATFGAVVAASTTDLSKHIALYSTSYGVNVTAGSMNFVANAANNFSITSSTVESKVNHNFAAGIDVTGQVTTVRSGGGAKDHFSIGDTTDSVYLVFRYNGTDFAIEDSLAAAGNRYADFLDSTGQVRLYYGGVAEVRTADSNFSDAISGLEVKDFDQNFRPVGFGDMESRTKSGASAYTLSETDIHKTLRVTNVTGGVTFPNDTGMRIGSVGWIMNTTTSDLTLTATSNNIEAYFGDGTAHATGNFTLAGKGWCTWRKHADSGTAAYEIVGVGLS